MRIGSVKKYRLDSSGNRLEDDSF